MNIKTKIIILIVYSFTAFNCGSARRSEPIKGELKKDAPSISEGEKVFNQHCQSCHPRGETGIGPAINNKSLPGFMIKFQVRNGIGKMPSFGENKISKKELSDLVDYLFALRRND